MLASFLLFLCLTLVSDGVVKNLCIYWHCICFDGSHNKRFLFPSTALIVTTETQSVYCEVELYLYV
jgi:hypothetical protein